MKKATLFATVLALALAASAQESHFPGSSVIALSARGGDHASANGVTTTQAPNAQPVSADAKAAVSGGPTGPPVQKQGANAVNVGGKTVLSAAK